MDEPASRDEGHGAAGGAAEVRRYLLRLIALIALGLLLMTLVAIWAFYQYGGKLQERLPLPDMPPAARPQ